DREDRGPSSPDSTLFLSKQKTAYELFTDWSSDVCSSDLLSPAAGAEFALIPAQNATGNWVKIAQRVPVRIQLDGGDDAPALRSGLSAWIEIDTGHRRRLFGYAWPDGK